MNVYFPMSWTRKRCGRWLRARFKSSKGLWVSQRVPAEEGEPEEKHYFWTDANQWWFEFRRAGFYTPLDRVLKRLRS